MKIFGLNSRPLAKIATHGQDAHPTKVIFSCGVGVSPAKRFNDFFVTIALFLLPFLQSGQR